MNRINTIIFGTIALIVLAVVILGPQKVESHVFAGRERIKEKVDDVSSDAQEAARIQYLLREFDRDVYTYQDKLADIESQLTADRQSVDKLKANLAEQRNILSRIRGLLAEDRPEYTIQGRTYTRSQVEEDALTGVSNSKSIENDLAAKRTAITKLEVVLKEGQASLKKAMAIRREKANELNELEVRLKNARMLGQVMELARGLEDAPLTERTELGSAFRNLADRVRDTERENAVLVGESRTGGVIDWDASPSTSALKAVEDYLGSPGDKPESSSSTAVPSGTPVELGRALSGATY